MVMSETWQVQHLSNAVQYILIVGMVMMVIAVMVVWMIISCMNFCHIASLWFDAVNVSPPCVPPHKWFKGGEGTKKLKSTLTILKKKDMMRRDKQKRSLTMSVALYQSISAVLDPYVDPAIPDSSRERLEVLVLGIIGSQSSSPAQMARAVYRSQLSDAQPASIERRLRRTENDAHLNAHQCFEPLAQAWLAQDPPQRAVIIVDPTTQDDRVVKITVSVWYRGRALPLVWDVYPANQPLDKPGFGERINALLNRTQDLLPVGTDVLCLADRAFGSPQFTDLIEARGWSYIVRVQGQTRCRDQVSGERRVDELVTGHRQRAHLKGEVFKGRGWRQARVVVYWRRQQDAPLCLVTNLSRNAATWQIIRLYRRRFAIEAAFRDEKSRGWQWEENPVTDVDHTRRLLVGLALAIWLAVAVGSQVAAEHLAAPVTPRSSRPHIAKFSLFTLGKHRLLHWFSGACHQPLAWRLTHWQTANWSSQAWAQHRYAFVFHSL